METERECAADQKCNRDKAPITPWNLRQVCEDANATIKAFYPANQLTLSNGVLGQTAAEPLPFPVAMMVSNNWYRQSWKMQAGARRVKNVIVTFEFGPPPRGLPVDPIDRDVVCRTVKSALEVLGMDVMASLGRQDLETLLDGLPSDMTVSAGLTVDDILQQQESVTVKELLNRVDSIVARIGSSMVNLIDLDVSQKRAMALAEYLCEPRLSGVVSLVEAEHIRVAMHRMQDDDTNVNLPCCLRCPGLSSRPLDASSSYEDMSRSSATNTIDQLWQFIDCDRTGFTTQQLAMIQTALKDVRYEARLQWWLRMRACRRRPQSDGSWKGTSIARVLMSPDETRKAALEESIELLRTGMAGRGIRSSDLFMAWTEPYRDGLSAEVAVNALKSLHIPGLSDAHVQRVVKLLMNSDGVVSTKQWEEYFPDSLRESGPDSSDESGERIDPREIGTSEVDDGMVRYRFRLVPHRHFTKVWTSSGISCAPLSVWKYSHLEEGGGWTAKRSPETRIRVNLGDLAVASSKQPQHGLALEVVDSVKIADSRAPSCLTEWLDKHLPHPVAFRLIWSERRGKVQVNAWRPIPPSEEFVAVGVVFSTTPEEPSVGEMRCLPRVWLNEERVERKMVWRDGSSMIFAQEYMGTVDALKEEGGGDGIGTEYKLRKERYGAGRVFNNL